MIENFKYGNISDTASVSTGNEDPENEPLPVNTSENIVIRQIHEESGKRPVVLPIILILLIILVIYFGSINSKTEDSAISVSTLETPDSLAAKPKKISSRDINDSALRSAQLQSVSNKNIFHAPANPIQLPPVNLGYSPETSISENSQGAISSPLRIRPGRAEAYVYMLREGDDEIALKKKFGKSWQQLKAEDPRYTELMPKPEKDIRIYGYVFFASGSETERNENIENALKSTPRLRRSDIIIVPDGILIP